MPSSMKKNIALMLSLASAVLVMLSVLFPEYFVEELPVVSSPAPSVVTVEVANSVDLVATSSAYPVTKVRDGDTIVVNVDGKDEAVRLVGINTPETVDPRKPVECFGKQSSEKMKALLQGKVVTLEADETQSDRDRYGRLLRFVFVEGEDVGLVMLREGYAVESLYSDVPHTYHQEYLRVQKEAQENKSGLWSDGVCDLDV